MFESDLKSFGNSCLMTTQALYDVSLVSRHELCIARVVKIKSLKISNPSNLDF